MPQPGLILRHRGSQPFFGFRRTRPLWPYRLCLESCFGHGSFYFCRGFFLLYGGQASLSSRIYTTSAYQHAEHEASTVWSFCGVERDPFDKIAGWNFCSSWNGDAWRKHVRRPILIVFRSIKSRSEHCTPLHVFAAESTQHVPPGKPSNSPEMIPFFYMLSSDQAQTIACRPILGKIYDTHTHTQTLMDTDVCKWQFIVTWWFPVII